MTFYLCEDAVCDQLHQYLEQQMLENGNSVQALVKENSALFANLTDEYSQALMLTNVIRKDAPLFANLPRSNFKWEIRDNLAEVFEAMELPTTQQQLYRLTGAIKRKGIEGALNPKQLVQLVESAPVQKIINEVATWCEKARQEIDIKKANLPLVSAATQEEKEFSNTLRFDWHYSYCDHISNWRAGNEQHGKVVQQTNLTLAMKPHLRKVVETVAKAHGFQSDFFTATP